MHHSTTFEPASQISQSVLFKNTYAHITYAMPSLILTGHPSSGKTTFAKVLAERALVHKSSLIQSVVIINESSARPDKTQRECYIDSTEEKLTRGALKTEFDKYVKDPTKLVILDSMNYIKGFRYELHCISKSAGQKHGVIWILNREDVAKAWNHEGSSRLPLTFYTLDMMNELMARYEPPDERNRWDRPLYRVDIHSTLEDCEFEKYGLSPYFYGNRGDKGSLEKGTEGVDKDESEGKVKHDEAGIAAEQVLTRSVYDMHSLSNVLLNSSSLKSNKIITSNVNMTPTSHETKQTKVGSSSFKRFYKDKTKQVELEKEGSIGKDILENGQSSHVDAACAGTVSHSQQPQPLSSPIQRERQVKKLEDLIDGILDSFLLNVEPLKAGISTTIQRSAESNLLHDVDVTTQKAMEAFLVAQKSISAGIGGGGGGKITVHVGSKGQTRVIELKRMVQFAEIKRLRRQYIKWSTRNPPVDTTEEGISNAFLSYVENQL